MRGRLHLSALLPADADVVCLSTRDLRERGMTKKDVRAAVQSGVLVRVRRGRYLPRETHPDVIAAACQGGLLDCVSLLALLGVFVLVRPSLHVLIPVGASRLPRPRRDVVRHWRPSSHHRSRTVSDIVEAVAQAVRCQPARAAIATIDSALHLRLLDEETLDRVFAALPHRYQLLRRLVDARSESGAESLARLILRTIGCSIEVQVIIEGVGRVDFLVDGWLIVECDSRAHHSDWTSVRRDRRRDVEAAARGYTTVRLLAEDIFDDPEKTADTLRRVIRSTPRHTGLLTRARGIREAVAAGRV